MGALAKPPTTDESGGMPRTVGERVLRAIREAKGSDPFAPVHVVTQLGARRLRMEVGRLAAVVNVHWKYPDQVTELPADAPVIVVGPVPDALSSLDVGLETPNLLDLSCTRVVSCPDAAVEARVAIHSLLQARQAESTPWSSMAVAVAAPSSQPMLIDALRRAGIPYFVGEGRPVSQSAAGRFVLGALAAARSNWNRGDISALWACAPVQDPATGSSVPVEQWERVSRRYKVVDRLDWEQLEHRAANGPSAAADVPIAQQLRRTKLNTAYNAACQRVCLDCKPLAPPPPPLRTTVASPTRSTASRRRPTNSSAVSKTTCRNGHPRIPENTYVRPDGEGECRICRKNARGG